MKYGGVPHMALKQTMDHMNSLIKHIAEDLERTDLGNKAAAQRVRTATIKLEKTAKLFRKESIQAEKKGLMIRKPKPKVKAAKKSHAEGAHKAAHKKAAPKKAAAKKAAPKKAAAKKAAPKKAAHKATHHKAAHHKAAHKKVAPKKKSAPKVAAKSGMLALRRPAAARKGRRI